MSATPSPGGRYTDDHDRFGTKRGVVHADHDPTLPARATGVSVQPESVHAWVADERRDAEHATWATAPDTRPDPWELDHE